MESLVLDYVDEIRDEVLQRFRLYSKSSHDIQMFISYLLDEYHSFVQAARHVATLVSYLVRLLVRLFFFSSSPSSSRKNTI